MKQPKEYIIFPLDVPSEKEAKQHVELLSEHVGIFKVGLELFIQTGPEIINIVKTSGPADVFLDLKLHDIPATVSRAMERVADLGVKFATVHCGENKEMLDAAVSGGLGKVGVLGVTVLTSVSSKDLHAAGFQDLYASKVSKLVMKRAAMAKASGCVGVVCSGTEVKMIKEGIGEDFIAVTPGIRPHWDSVGTDDQHRVTTPAQAIKNGSDFLVIGRPIRDAKDPKSAAIRIAEEIETAL